MQKSLLLTIFIFISPTFAVPQSSGDKLYHCASYLEPDITKALFKWKDNSRKSQYWVQDGPSLFASGEIDESGGLAIDIRTIALDGSRSPLLHGREQFLNIVNHFKGKFDYINGHWLDGDNLKTFNKLVYEGRAPEDAALETWTGLQAKSIGYGQAVVDAMTGGRPGRYEEVNVRFYPTNLER